MLGDGCFMQGVCSERQITISVLIKHVVGLPTQYITGLVAPGQGEGK